MKRFLLVLNIFAALASIVIVTRYVVTPFISKIVYADEYKTAMFQCDNTMRDHLIAKHRVLADPSEKSISALEAAELGLTACHKYDKLRKKLLNFGISPAEIALLGLEKMEEKATDVMDLVEIHEFRY